MATTVESQPTQEGEIQLEHAYMKIQINYVKDTKKACAASESSQHSLFLELCICYIQQEKTLCNTEAGLLLEQSNKNKANNLMEK